jgi:hypothetical protein
MAVCDGLADERNSVDHQRRPNHRKGDHHPRRTKRFVKDEDSSKKKIIVGAIYRRIPISRKAAAVGPGLDDQRHRRHQPRTQ